MTSFHFFRFISTLYYSVVLIVALSASANARTILFIDLNNASAEIDAIRTSLDRDRDQLFVVPSLSKLDLPRRKAILKTTEQINALTTQSLDCAKRGRVYCESLWSRLRLHDQERATLTGAYTTDDLIADIKTTVGEQTQIDVLMISGHHSGSYFRGELAALEANDLLRFDIELAQQFSATRSLLLLGCETGVPTLMSDLFIKALPSLQLIAGAEDNAPTRNESRNLQFIRQLMRSEAQLAATKDVQVARQTYRALLNAAWPVSLLWQRSHFFSRDWQGPVASIPPSIAATFASAHSMANSAAPTTRVASAPTIRAAPAVPVRREISSSTAPMLSPREAIDILRSQ
jgi:hypothetical protein